MSFGMRHVSPIVERFKAARRRSAGMRIYPRLPVRGRRCLSFYAIIKAKIKLCR